MLKSKKVFNSTGLFKFLRLCRRFHFRFNIEEGGFPLKRTGVDSLGILRFIISPYTLDKVRFGG